MPDQMPSPSNEDLARRKPMDPELEQLLRSSTPDAPPARPSFESALRTRFIDDVRKQALSAAAQETDAVRDGAGSGGLMHKVRRLFATDGDGTGSWRKSPILVPAALVVLIAVFGWFALSGGPSSLFTPPAVTAAELGKTNAEAWASVRSLAGAFETASGDRYEEWVVWSDEGLERYRRLRAPMDEGAVSGEWLVSDGHDEWVVDDLSGAVVASRPAPAPGQESADLGCVSLALPQGIAGAVTPERLDGRPMYRVAPAGEASDAAIAAYWVDANDHLVYRIDGQDGQVLWQRMSLELNPELPDELFDPKNLDRLGA